MARKVALCIYTTLPKEPWGSFYRTLRSFYSKHACIVKDFDLRSSTLHEQVQVYSPDVVVVWNGYSHVFRQRVNLLRRGKWKMVFHETAWFPQRDSVYFDNYGVLGDAFKHEDLYRAFDVDSFHRWRATYLASVSSAFSTSKAVADKGVSVATQKVKISNYILVVGQVENDTSMQFSEIQEMSKLLDAVINHIPSGKIIYRDHPAAKGQVQLPKGITRLSNTLLYETIEKARVVIGLNSTVLLESLLLHKQTIALARNVWPDKDILPVVEPKDIGKALQYKYDWDKVDQFLDHLRRSQVSLTSPEFSGRNEKVLLP